MTEHCRTAYQGIRERVSDLVAGLDPGADAATVPATPAWTVHDVLAHLVGVARDAVEGRMDGVTTEAGTAAQVDRRRGTPTADLLAEWDEVGPRFEHGLSGSSLGRSGQAVLDATSHEHDLRHATGRPGARDSDAVAIAFEWACVARHRGRAPAVRLRTEAGERVTGTGEPVATATTSRFEFVRAATGRRSADEVRAWGWEGPCDPAALLLAPIFTLRPVGLREG